jgi:hypothetical protein
MGNNLILNFRTSKFLNNFLEHRNWGFTEDQRFIFC